jgi:hypothetical protein
VGSNPATLLWGCTGHSPGAQYSRCISTSTRWECPGHVDPRWWFPVGGLSSCPSHLYNSRAQWKVQVHRPASSTSIYNYQSAGPV